MALDFPASPTTGQVFTVSGTTWVYDGVKWNAGGNPTGRQVPVAFPFVGKPSAGVKYNVTLAWSATIAANFAGSVAFAGVNPTASATFAVNKVSSGSTVSVGTIVISTAGAATFTSGGAAFAIGDVLQLVAPLSADPTLADVGITILTVLQ